jgi:anti-anti-sigma factor
MQLADVRYDLRGRVIVAHVAGEVDVSNADELRAALVRRMTNDARGLLLDLTDLRYIDSAGINFVYELRGRLKDRGQELRLVVPAGSPASDTLHLANVSRAVGVVETTDAGLESMGFPETGAS